jgi:hypothetical protein
VSSNAFTLSEGEEWVNGKLEKLIFVTVLQEEIWKTKIKGREREWKRASKKTRPLENKMTVLWFKQTYTVWGLVSQRERKSFMILKRHKHRQSKWSSGL